MFFQCLLSSNWVLLVSVGFSSCSPSVCWVLTMFSQCVLGSKHILPVSTGFSTSLLGSLHVLTVSDGFYVYSPSVCWVLLMLVQCLLGFSQSTGFDPCSLCAAWFSQCSPSGEVSTGPGCHQVFTSDDKWDTSTVTISRDHIRSIRFVREKWREQSNRTKTEGTFTSDSTLMVHLEELSGSSSRETRFDSLFQVSQSVNHQHGNKPVFWSTHSL